MTQRTLLITRDDCRRLQHLLDSEFAAAIDPKNYLNDLRAELLAAKIVESNKVPPDVVTMRSTVRLCDLDSNEEDIYTLVYPDQADIARSRLSVLAPVGTAILGYRVGDVIQWRVPNGTRRLRVEEVIHQPQRDGFLEAGSVVQTA
ncbi:nucleoside diphosphate kinase regulator [Aeoliella sp. SH292]|uniref:nucleoside diphosphate kinase regulator n=1 Tax=Aeoliella sp. SH292 TaxID=3454464 RepID=UPI003F9E20E6